MDVVRLRLHFIYVTIILGLVIICLATAYSINSGSPHLVDYVTFAATVTSLVLAVLAIFYSIVSNRDLSSSLGSLQTTSARLSGPVESLT